MCEADARKYLQILFEKRRLRSDIAIDLYEQHQFEAEERMKHRDLDDCPIWTEDKDFFGSEVPTWTTDRIHFF